MQEPWRAHDLGCDAMKTADIRNAFIQFFESHQHKHLPSGSLIPHHDPSLLFTNAGMVPFKSVFLGDEKAPAKRVVTAQRCLRAGGKHNDLDNVGYTARHHTFFEMLGNFSFGDYFKREAIQYAWDFLTKTLKLPAERLWVTVYQDDAEAEAIWLNEMGVDPKRFSRCGEADNFWSMGDTGPCGPCSEIFYDHGPEVPGGPPGSPDQEGDRYVEIWNMVFMQYNRDAQGQLTPLPQTAVDTGMGIERIAAVLQGVHSNYETDAFTSIIEKARDLSPMDAPPWSSLCVLADHIRASCFLILDGVTPSNEGRGYVLRRIIRRAIRHGHQCEMQSPFFEKLVAPLVALMQTAYPELAEKQSHIESLLHREEMQFSETLSRGLKILTAAMAELGEGKVLPGDVAFKLYDTYGFPLDLTADICRGEGITVDDVGFTQHMQSQKSTSQASQQFAAKQKALDVKETSVFCGYDHRQSPAKVLALYVDGQGVNTLEKDQEAMMVLDQTPFYAESGGQVGDTGVISMADDFYFEVHDTQKERDAVLHVGVVTAGRVQVGDAVEAAVSEVRDQIMRHHSATHLLHAALRRHLGDQVVQKGSLVDAHRLRFDFTSDQALTVEDCEAIENDVNANIRANWEVSCKQMTLEDAKASGAMMLFGEKYGERVRVLTMGEASVELCGGTHVARTGDIGAFKIMSESGVAAGIRRIEAVAGHAADCYVRSLQAILLSAAEQAQCPTMELPDKILQMQDKLREQTRVMQQHQKASMASQVPTLLSQAKAVGDVKVVVGVMPTDSREALRELMDALRKEAQAIVFLVGEHQDQLILLAGVNASLRKAYPAKSLMQSVAKALGGKGGGRDDLAQGGASGPVSQSQLESLVVAWCESQVAAS